MPSSIAKQHAKRYDFVAAVHEIVQQIPRGKVTSYGAIARYIGAAKSARLVGWALQQPPYEGQIPAHRVVNRQGMLSGALHFGSPTAMKELLEADGVQVLDQQVQELDAHFWDPADGLL